MTQEIIRVKVENISKKFNIDLKKQSLLSRVLEVSGRRESILKRDLGVLKDVSFEVKQGEILGLIGKNGSGKSTLLKIIAGIYRPDYGTIATKGSVVYLNGLKSGLMPKLTMRENIFLMGSVMGLSQNDIKNRFDEIVEFSGLREFVDNKVCHFSSGMVSRLNFSVTIHCLKHKNPDILLLDEVFGAGGDIDFQQKGTAKMEELIKGGATVILASHSLEIIKKHCDKAVLLKRENIAVIGGTEDIIEKYIKST